MRINLKLDNEALAEGFFENSHLLGLVAPVKDYYFSWQLNLRLGYRFRLNNDIEMQLTKKKRQYFFPVYEHDVPNRHVSHFLYNNQHEGEYLLPEFKHLDFLWLIKGEQGEEVDAAELKAIIEGIRCLPFVQLVSEMTHEKIKHKTHLVF